MMAILEKKVMMAITCNDRMGLSFGETVLKEIKEKMEKENADCLENSYTGEIIEWDDIEKALQVINSLLDSQQGWKWELI